MKNILRRALAALSVGGMLLAFSACGKTEYAADQSFLFGINYVDTQMSDRLTVAQVANLAQASGAKSVRLCVGVMETGGSMITAQQTRLHSLLSACSLSGIDQVIVQTAGFPQDNAIGYTAPAPDLSDNEYTDFLKAAGEMAALLVKEFPEVAYWQIGHHLNSDTYLHPLGWQESDSPVEGFTVQEKAFITADLQYAVTKAIRDAGSGATVLMADMKLTDTAADREYLKAVYDEIASGKHGSKKVTDFFDAVAWDPTLTEEPGERFTEKNEDLYAVIKKAGDDGRKVYLTEIGTESTDDQQETHAAWLKKAYEAAKKLPFVESMYWYRFFNDGEERYGLMNEPRAGFGPTEKGKAFQEAAGGTGDLSRYVIREDQYTSGDNVALNVPTAASSSCEHPGWGWSLSGVNNGTLDYGGWSNYYEFGTAEWATSPTGNGANDPKLAEWVEFYLPYVWEIDTVLLYPRNEVDEQYRQLMGLPREAEVAVSDDGTTWKKVAAVTIKPQTYAAGVTQITRAENPPIALKFSPVKTKYVRVTFPTLCTNSQHMDNNYFVQLEEIEILMH